MEDVNPLVIELVLRVMEPHYLLSSRFVNRTWNSIATRLLDKSGYTLPLRTDEFRKYLKKVKKADEPKPEVPIANLGLATHIDFSEPRISENIQHLLKICELSPARSPLTSLACMGCWKSGARGALLQLTRINAPTLRHLSFSIFNEDTTPTSASSVPVHLDHQLPALQSVTVKFIFPQEQGPHPMVLDHILATPNLEHLSIFSLSGPSDAISMLQAIHQADPRRLANLIKLDIPSNFDQQDLPDGLTFTRLRSLRLYSSEAETAFRIPQFAADEECCPELREMELEVFHFGAALPEKIHLDETVLPKVRHFGFKGNLCQLSRLATLEGRHGEIGTLTMELPIVDGFLRTMNNFPNLVTATLGFENLVALAKLFTSLDGRMGHFIPPAFCVSKWPKLTRLELHMDTDDSYSATSSDLGLVCWLVNEMYPNLEKLCLKLNGETNSLISPSRLRHALGMILGIKGVKVKEASIVLSHYTIWDFDFEQPVVGPKFETTNLGLKTLTIGLASSQPLSARSPYTNFSIPKLLEMIPEGSDLHLRIDARLPLSGCDQSYGELTDELQKLRPPCPRVVLF